MITIKFLGAFRKLNALTLLYRLDIPIDRVPTSDQFVV